MRDDGAAPAEPSAGPSGGPPAGFMLGERHVRMLRIAVIAMGVVLVLGFVTVIARIVYLVNRGGETTSVASQPAQETARLALPAGASVRHIALAGQRLAVHYDGPAGSGILILDLQTGKPVSRIEIVPETPR
ncbi:MAG: DUF6476 family protein [Hyphomicrobiaceae bacterium]